MAAPPPLTPPTPVDVFADIDSTNAEAMRRIAAGVRGPLWIRAERQTSGRGRSGRTWVSDAGNHYASLIFAPGCAPAQLQQLTLVAGVAVVDAIRAVGGAAAPPGLTLKWPNDVLVGAAKLTGILIESQAGPATPDVVAVIGIGINLAHAPSAGGAPESAGRAVTSLAELGCPVAPAAMLAALDRAMADWLARWQAGAGFAEIRAAWLARGMALGTPISVHATDGPRSGTFAGLDADGALRLQSGDGAMTRVTFGDVTILRSPGKGSGQA